MRDLTFICAFYENPGMLREQQRLWSEYPPDLKARFHAIVTDDCSPEGKEARPVFACTGLASQRLYRIAVNRRWDWLICRNLGVQEATTDWVLLTDIDHALPSATLRWIVEADLDATAVYRFSRVDAPAMTPYKPHPNTWMLTRALFDRIGGYDERFSGYYGSDSEFRERVQATASATIMRPEPLIRYAREVIPDASTTTYERKAKIDGKNIPRIKDEIANLKDRRPLRVTLPYTLEASC